VIVIRLARCGGTDGQPICVPRGGELVYPFLPIVDRLTCDHAQIDSVGVLADADGAQTRGEGTISVPVACRKTVEGADRLPIAGVTPPDQESLPDRLSNPGFEGPGVERSPSAVTGDERDRGEHPGDDAVAQCHSQTDEGRDAQGGKQDRQPQKVAGRFEHAPDQCDDPLIVGFL